MSKKTATELEFLLYFYSQADDAFGPASDDVYHIIKQNFEDETGKKLPKGYGLNEDEEEENG